MNQSFRRWVRNAALATALCLCAALSMAQAAGKDWQAMMDEIAALVKQQQHERAIELAYKAVAEAEARVGGEHENIALSLTVMADSFTALGQYGKALPLQLRALGIRERVFGANHVHTAQSLESLASTYFDVDQYEKALTLRQRSLTITERALGPNHTSTAQDLNNLAVSYRSVDQNDKALPLLHRALSIREKALGLEHPETAQSLGNLGISYGLLKQYDKALPLLLRSLAIREKILGPEHPDTARSMEILAGTYSDLNQHDKALSLLQRSLAIGEKVLNPEHPKTARSRALLAITYSKLGRFDMALPLDLRALAIAEKVFGVDHRETATSLTDLARTYRNLAQHNDALPLQMRALAIHEKANGPDHADTAQGLNELAGTYQNLAQYERALELRLRALAIRERILGPDDPDIAMSLHNLAGTYGSLAEYDKALSLQRRALSIYERTLGSEHANTASVLAAMAAIHGTLAQYDKALPLQHRVLSIREKTLGPAHPGIVRSLRALATTYGHLARYDKAVQLAERSLAITEKALGPEHPETARSLYALAGSYGNLAQYDKALQLGQRALAIYEKTLGTEHPDAAESMGALAFTYRRLLQFDRALALEQRALAVGEKIYGPEHPNTANFLHNIAIIHYHLKHYEESLRFNQRALAIYERALGPGHPYTAASLGNLAQNFARTGQLDLAISLFKSAVNAYQSQRQEISQIGAAELIAYTGSVAHTYQDLAALLIEQGRLPEAQLVLDMLKEDEQFDFIRRSGNADSRSTRIGYNATEQVWMTRYRQVANQLATRGVEEQALQKQAKLGLNAEQKRRQQELAADLRVAQLAFEAFLKEMRDSFASQGSARAAEVVETSVAATRELQDLIKGLDHGAVILQYYVTEDKVGMLLTTPGVQLARSSTVSARELNRQIADFRRLLRDPKADLLKSAQALYQLLVAPVAQDLAQAGAKTVMLSLDGALRYLPFGALHDGQRYLVERWNMPMYTSVTKSRLRDAVAPRWQAAGLGVTRKQGEFGPLPAVKEEMRGIVIAAGGGVLPGEVHLDEAFTAARLRDVSLRPFQLLHVASHFRFSPGTEVNSFLLLGDGEHLSLGDIRTQNYRFDNVDLLTLSACDTGLGGGRDAQGREIEGFGVIAQQQGAKAVLATLWPVADQSTATLMAEMYRRRQEQHLTKIEALRQAQLSLLAQSRYAHPFYWAPFIVMGNWR